MVIIMKNYMEYKGFHGSVQYSKEDDCLYGNVLGITDGTILFEGSSVDELRQDFEDAVDDYIVLKKEHGESTNPPVYPDDTQALSCACHQTAN